MLKRCFDFSAALFAVALLSPLLLILALLVRVRLGSPVLFRQTRPGRGGRTFAMWKFRTMTDARDAEGRLLPDSVRLTPFRRWLRATSLDELPELWNVLRGVVGPRPFLVEYLPLYSPEQARRHEARQGITGWAQINGRNALSWDEKFRLDCGVPTTVRSRSPADSGANGRQSIRARGHRGGGRGDDAAVHRYASCGQRLIGQVTATHYRVEGVKSGISVVWKTMG